jgi:hypothetical protein
MKQITGVNDGVAASLANLMSATNCFVQKQLQSGIHAVIVYTGEC